ncbi:MAG TPA: hypothetical protein PK794_02825, partial [Armatimonadota bacterium]|nr:hypothetical protein [Armatimonadota bacterium]
GHARVSPLRHIILSARLSAIHTDGVPGGCGTEPVNMRRAGMAACRGARRVCVNPGAIGMK